MITQIKKTITQIILIVFVNSTFALWAAEDTAQLQRQLGDAQERAKGWEESEGTSRGHKLIIKRKTAPDPDRDRMIKQQIIQLEEQQRQQKLKPKQELKQKIDSLYTEAKDLYYKDQFSESINLFNQILSLDPSQKTAIDYLTNKIPQRQAKLEEQRQRQEQERQRQEELKKQAELERQRLEELKIQNELKQQQLEEQRRLAAEPKDKAKLERKPTKAKPKKEIREEEKPPEVIKDKGEKEDEEYRVKPFDTLTIKVYEEEALSGDYKVQKGGFIDIPLVRKVQVEGLTVYEIEDKLTALLAKDYLVNPQIMITVKEFHVDKIILLGQVTKPGTYSLSAEEPVTLLRAISMAGGFTNIAAMNNVKIIRMEKGKKTTRLVKTSEIIDGKKEDVVLQPGDIVVVPESFW